MNILSNLALILSLGGNYYMGKQSQAVFPIWITSNVLWIIINLVWLHNIQQIIMYCIYIAMQAWSWYQWRKA